MDRFRVPERLKALAFYPDERGWRLYNGVKPRMAATGPRKSRAELNVYQFGDTGGLKAYQRW
jgi:hypothetical protein